MFSSECDSIIIHYDDVIMGTMASQITSLTVVYSTVYSDADQRKHQSSAPLAFVWGNHRDQWIPRTKGQLRGKCFHLMTSSCFCYCIFVTKFLRELMVFRTHLSLLNSISLLFDRQISVNGRLALTRKAIVFSYSKLGHIMYFTSNTDAL